MHSRSDTPEMPKGNDRFSSTPRVGQLRESRDFVLLFLLLQYIETDLGTELEVGSRNLSSIPIKIISRKQYHKPKLL